MSKKDKETRIVEMQFDNEKFEKNIKRSTESLENFENSLKMDGAEKGFKGIENAVETVHKKFSALEIMGTTALVNITNSAVNAGKQLIKSLSVDQVSAGWNKLTEETSSVQTIMNATGKSIDEVEGHLEKLMWFSDETSYGFTDMTAALGQLAASGADIDKMIPMITGIADATAFAGKGANEFQRSIYNLTQSFGTGHLQLMDWKSLENAGTATSTLKQTLIDTAVELGKLQEVDGKVVFTSISDSAAQATEEIAELQNEMEEALKKVDTKYASKTTQTANMVGSKYYGITTITSGGKTNEEIEAEKAAIRKKYEKKIAAKQKKAGGKTTEVNVGTFGSTLSEGWADTEVMEKAFAKFSELSDAAYEAVQNGEYDTAAEAIEALSGKYSDLSVTAFKAAQVSKSFADAVDATKDAVSTGWMKTFKTIFGNIEEQKALWTELTSRLWDVFASGAETRNELLDEWKDLGGRDKLVESFWNAWDGVASVINPIKDSFRDVFPQTTAKRLVEITENVRKFTEKMNLSDEQAEKLKKIFTGVFSLIGAGIHIVKGLVTSLEPIANVVRSLFSKVFDATAVMGELAASFGTSLKESQTFNDGLRALTETAEKFSSKMSTVAGPVLGGLCEVLQTLWGFIKKIGSAAGKMISGIWSALSDAITADNPAKLLSLLNTTMFSVLLVNARKAAKNIGGAISELTKGLTDKFGKVLDGITGVLDSVRDSLSAWQQSLRAGTLLKIAAAVGILALSLIALAGIKKEGLDTALKALTGVFADMMLSMLVLSKVGKGSRGMMSAATSIVVMSVAVRILAGALESVSAIDPARLSSCILAIAELCLILVGVFKLLAVGGSGAAKGAAQMIFIAAAIKILGSVCRDLSGLSWEDMAKGLLGVAALMGGMVAFTKAVKINKGMMSNATAMVVLSSSLKILASVVGDFAAMDWGGITKGLVAVGVLLGELAGFSNLMGNAKKLKSAAVVTIAIAIAMKMLVDPMKSFASMSWEDIAKGLTVVAGSLMVMAAATRLIKPQDLLEAATVLPIMAASMTEMAKAFWEIGKLSWGDLAKGLAALCVSLAGLTIVLKLLKGTVKASASLLIAAMALNVLAVAVKAFSSGSLETTIISLGSMAVTFLILAGAMKLIKPLIPTMLKFSGSLTALGTSMTVFAAALTAVGVGTTMVLVEFLSVVTAFQNVGWGKILKGLVIVAGAFAGIGLAAKLLKPLIPSIFKLGAAMAVFGLSCFSIGVAIALVVSSLTTFAAVGEETARDIARSLTALITEFLDGIPAMAASIVKGLSAIAVTVVKEFASIAPVILEGLLQSLLNSADVIRKYIPDVVSVLVDFICDILDEVAKSIPKLSSRVANVVKALVDALKTSFSVSDMANALLTIKDIALAMLEMAAAAKLISEISIGGAVKGVIGFAAVVGGMLGILTLLGAISKIAGLNDIVDNGAKLFSQLGKAIGAFVGSVICGLVDNMPTDLEKLFVSFGSIAALIGILSPISETLGNINIVGSTKGVAGVVIMIGGLAAILAALGGLKQIPGFEWLIGEGAIILEALGSALGRTVGALIQGISDAITSDIQKLTETILEIMEVLGATALVGGVLSKLKLDPVACAKGGAAIAILLGELAAVLAILGGLKQIPGFDWIIDEGGEMLCKLGSIVGEFVGSVISGLGVGLTSGLPEIGTNLGEFMTNAEPFMEGIKNIDSDAVNGLNGLVGMILKLTGANLLNSITSWITGGSSFADFADELVPFGKAMREYAEEVTGINNAAVVASANAGSTLAELANALPSEGGLKEWFAGGNDLANFATEIIPFGTAMRKYAAEVSGIDNEAVVSSANAGKTLVDLAAALPSEGGIKEWFAGGNDLANFAREIIPFGTGMRAYAAEVTGIDNDAVVSSANAGKSLAELADTLPNEGGLKEWFVGGNDLANFAQEIIPFGAAMKQYAINVGGIDSEAVSASAVAGKALSEMAAALPDHGGISEWFMGDNSLSDFAEELVPFGSAMKRYGDNVVGLDTTAVTASANAGKTLAEMAGCLPDHGGIAGWFAGDNSLSDFAEELVPFGSSMKLYGENLKGLDADTVVASANAGKALAEMAGSLPDHGGITDWFTGDSSLSDFAAELIPFGSSMKQYGENIKGLDTDAVVASTNAGNALSEMAANLPEHGGITDWFTGDSSLAAFAEELVPFGSSMKQYSQNINGLNTDAVTASATAAQSLSELAGSLPDHGGITDWFTGDNSLATFAAELVPFGESMQSYYLNVKDLKTDVVEKSVGAAKSLTGLAENLPSTGGLSEWFSGSQDLGAFGESLITFGEGFAQYSEDMKNVDSDILDVTTKAAGSIVELQKSLPKTGGWFSDGTTLSEFGSDMSKFGSSFEKYYSYISGVDTAQLSDVITETNRMVEMVNGMCDVSSDSAKSFGKALTTLADDTITNFVGEFNGAEEKVKNAAASMLGYLISGMEENKTFVALECYSIAKIVNDVLASDIDSNPVIRPVLDLSEIEKGTAQLSSMLSADHAISVSSGLHKSSSENNQQSGISPQVGGNVYNFNQNISSPKALDTLTIYRQTRNQFARMAEGRHR